MIQIQGRKVSAREALMRLLHLDDAAFEELRAAVDRVGAGAGATVGHRGAVHYGGEGMNEFLITLAGLGTVVGFFTGMLAGRSLGWWQRLRRRPTADAELTVDLSMRCTCGRTVTIPAGFTMSMGMHKRLGDVVIDSLTGLPVRSEGQ
jgi:hypothetical protein